MQREILNVAKACQLPGFRYVRFAPVPIAPRPRAEAPAEAPSPSLAEPEPAAMPAVAAATPPDPVPSAAMAPRDAPIDAPAVDAPAVAPRWETVAAPAAEVPVMAVAPPRPAPRHFALLDEMTQSIAERVPQRRSGQVAQAVAGDGQAVPQAIKRSPRPPRAPRPPVDAAGAAVAQPALLAEITASLHRRGLAAAPTADVTAAPGARPSRTP